MEQLSFLEGVPKNGRASLERSSFSHQSVAAENERIALEKRYTLLLDETARFNRKLVSFQASKNEILHGWLKYREGFSPQLVDTLLDEFEIGAGDRVLEPFAGSATTLLVAMMRGIDATGIELLPHCHLAWEAKSQIARYSVDELKQIARQAATKVLPRAQAEFPHLTITEGAFSETTEQDLLDFTQWFEEANISEDARILSRLVLTSILESVSYTRKDGQYLRWDGRSSKLQQRNHRRSTQGKKEVGGIDKGILPTVRDAFSAALKDVIRDIEILQKQSFPVSNQILMEGSTLYVLSTLAADQFACVITSPPYANRYDYTRTYALELAYLGVKERIFDLRQSLLSCTVENRSKLEELRAHYEKIKGSSRFNAITQVINQNGALREINLALQLRQERGEINNRGVLTMIENYFTELTFVFAEIFRVCRPGAYVAFVNDNVRYAGEIIPVDLLCTNLAEQLGFEPVKVYVLPQRKGNSSQQMGKFGRAALRKSITIWRKP
ncbi:MAG: site-specific DNA-methyltransferase [Caldilineaceae bacterium]|nr:site-specific DNA-methyltransferase [Caldilineaceae bacterium]